MLCIACAKPGWPLCDACERGLVVTHDRVVGGVPVGAAFQHTGTAVRLVHNLKYRRSMAAGRFLAEAMAQRVPTGATALVPVRRSLVRRVRFGIDQAEFLARAISDIVGLPVRDVVRAPLWWSQRAGAPRSERRPVRFGASAPVADGAVLVDDVFTTGSTILSAGRAIEPTRYSSLVATAAGKMKEGVETAPSLGGDVADMSRARTDRAPAAQAHSPTVHPESRRMRRARQGVPTERSTGDRSYPR
jgi:predicted amidophosphoribosyltransferase